MLAVGPPEQYAQVRFLLAVTWQLGHQGAVVRRHRLWQVHLRITDESSQADQLRVHGGCAARTGALHPEQEPLAGDLAQVWVERHPAAGRHLYAEHHTS